MTHNRSQWNRSHVHWAKKQNHDDDIPSSSRNASARESPKEDVWNNWGEAGEVENQGACWNVPLKFEGANREEYRVVFDWDDLAAKEAFYSPTEPTLQDYLADCERYSAFIDWETRRSCSLPECSEVMTREENKRKLKGSYTRHENSRAGSPVIIGLPTGRDFGGNEGGVSSIHLPLFAVPPATGWGDEGDVVPTPTGWGEDNTTAPVLTGWGDNGDVNLRPVTVWDDKKESAPKESGCDGGWFGHGNAPVSQRAVVPMWAEVAARPAVSERSEVTARHGPSRWAEVAARTGVSERAEFATQNQVSGWEGSTAETLATPADSRWEPVGPVVSGLEFSSQAQDPMNVGWMQPTFPDNPESYKHIVPSGWGDFPEDTAPKADIEMKPYCKGFEENWIAHDLPPSSRSGYDRAGCGTSYGTGHVHHDKQRHGSSNPFKYGSDYWKLKKESEPRNNFEPHYRRNSQRPGRSPIANNLRVYQDSKPSRGSRLDRAKTSVWQAACALSHDEQTSLMKNAKNGIRT